MLNTLTLAPAYGKVYKTIDEALTAWKSGKDFWINELQTYGSIRNTDYFKREMYYVWITVGKQSRCVVGTL